MNEPAKNPRSSFTFTIDPPLTPYKRWCLGLYTAAACGCAFLYWFQTTPEYLERGSGLGQTGIVVVYTDWIDRAGMAWAVLCLVMAGLTVIYGPTKRHAENARHPLYRLVALGFSLAMSYLFLFHFFLNVAPWQVYGPAVERDGRQYFMMESSFLQGQTLALGKLDGKNSFRAVYSILETTNGDSPRSFASLVRPANQKSNDERTEIIGGRMLLGFRYGNHCFLAYDFESGKAYGREEIGSLSPFILIGPGDEMNKEDVVKLKSFDFESVPNGFPTEASLFEALKHPNPAVRELAGALLKAIAQKRIADSPDYETGKYIVHVHPGEYAIGQKAGGAQSLKQSAPIEP